MYVKPPGNAKGGMKIPENYAGNAFSRSSPYSEMPPPVRTQTSRYDLSPVDIVRDELNDMREDTGEVPSQTYNSEDEVYEENMEKADEKKSEPSRAVGSSIFSALLPKGNLSSHFPFGHGLGSEELLILAVMLMVFLSGNECGEVDSEFLLLLGLLLFAG